MKDNLHRIRKLVEGVSSEQLGTGVYKSPKQPGFWKTIQRGMNTIKSLSTVANQGAPVLPVKGKTYIDDTGDKHQFSNIITGLSNADPYYFEFEHTDTKHNQTLILYGQAHAARSTNAHSKPIILRIKDVLKSTDNTRQSIEESRRLKKSKLRKKRDDKYRKRDKIVSQTSNRLTFEQFINHVEIRSLITRYNEMKNISPGNNIGDVYGTLSRSVPGDDTSMWKLSRRVKRPSVSKTLLQADYSRMFDKFMSKHISIKPGQSIANTLGSGPIELAAQESGLPNINSIKDTAKALLKYATNNT